MYCGPNNLNYLLEGKSVVKSNLGRFGIGYRILILPKGKDTNNGPQTNLKIAMKLPCIIIFFVAF
jgi:hypothetical protein